jgi:DNA-binding MarR family transcriptional regulator
MKRANSADPLKLSWDEIGFLCEGVSLASQPMWLAVKEITAEYSLGPRGAWITVVISAGEVYPLDVAKVFRVGRSLVTVELTRLIEAGLIVYEQNASDGRRMELKLTPLGNAVQRRVKNALSKLVHECLSGYKREDVLLCARMLRDFRVRAAESAESAQSLRKSAPPSKEKRRSPMKRATPVPLRRRD